MEITESEIRQIFASIVWNHKIHEKQSDIYSFRNKFLGIVNILCSTLTTSGLLAIFFTNDSYILKVITTIFSAIVLFISTFEKTYDLKEMHNKHKATALDFCILKQKTISLLVDIKTESIDNKTAIRRRDEIIESFYTICKNALNTSDRAVKKARKSLKEYKDNFYSDEEIDSYLPVKLRKEQ